MKKFLSFVALLSVVIGLSTDPVFAQTSINTTTLATAVNSVSGTTLQVASASTLAVGQMLYIDRELMTITGISGTQIRVTRGMGGTASSKHASGRIVYSGAPNVFVQTSPAGACTPSDQLNYPVINTTTAEFYNCSPTGTGAASTYSWKGVTFYPFSVVSWPRTPISDASYAVKQTDVVIAFTSINVPRFVTLSAFTGQQARMLVIIDESGAASTSKTIAVSGTVNGSTSNVINSAYGVLRLWWSGTAWYLW